MNPALLRLASSKHQNVALSAFGPVRSHVETGLMTEYQLQQSIASSRASSIPKDKAFTTITRAFNAARRDKT